VYDYLSAGQTPDGVHCRREPSDTDEQFAPILWRVDPAHDNLGLSSEPVEGGRLAMIPAVRLAYENSELAPLMSAETIEYHYGKHYTAYIRGVNEAILGSENEARPLEAIVEYARLYKRPRLFRNAGQAWNHGFFFSCVSRSRQNPNDALVQAIKDSFGGQDQFVRQFVSAGSRHFASGWLWLTATREGELGVVTTKNAEPAWIATEVTPLVVCDLWEHAYYIDWRNNRAGYLEEFAANWINWELAGLQYAAALGDEFGWRHP
jgi:Fe-Mn family superoxide dismutase